MDPESGEHLTRRAAPAVLHAPPFRLFTKESLTRIQTRIQQEKAAHEAAKEDGEQHEKEKEEEKSKPDASLEIGKKLPSRMGDFPPELYGKPIEDLDEYYDTKYTFMVVGKDKSLYRFSATNANFCLTPFNPVRRTAIFVLCHPAFGLFVMLVILVNCVFMASKQENDIAELVFTAIYTVEGTIKIVARGFILKPFTYLRDMWNWLDFIVVSFAYITMLPVIDLGNVSALRTARVLRALKTVAVVPGLKTIVGALLEAVIRLRDVMILSVFILAIFALVGLQVYQGTLTFKCVAEVPHEMENVSWPEKMEFYSNETNWLAGLPGQKQFKVCGNGSAERCPESFVCRAVGPNPDYGYTSFDNFGWAMLCAFRLMTQDFWENLYQLIIRANGPWHMCFFVIVILLGSFYLLNLILAIVAMSYDEQQKQDLEDEEAEEEELLEQEALRLVAMRDAENIGLIMKSPSGSFISIEQPDIPGKERVPEDDKERISIRSDCGMDRRLSIVTSKGRKVVQPSLSLPGTPYTLRRGSRDSKFSWRRRGPSPRSGDRQPLVLPYLHNLDLPYADDSAAVTPEDLCNPQNTQSYLGHRRRLSSTSYSSKMSHLESKFAAGSRRSSFASHQSRRSYSSHAGGELPYPQRERIREPTHFHWNTSFRHRQHPTHPLSLYPEIVVDKTKSDDNESSSSGSECETAKGKLFPDNPFICRTPSTTMVDMQDMLVLQDLFNHASGKRKSFLSCEAGMSRKEWLKTKCLQLIFGWECCPCWHKFAHYVELFIMDAFVDLFITLCIVVNTMFMGLDHYNMDEDLKETLKIGNYVFTTIFTAEAVLKIIALNPINYCKDKWNCFDIVIVILSLVELALQSVRGLSILRSFRLLRVFKLAKSWPTLNLLIGIIGRTMGALGNLCFVLGIIIFIFAVMGMQLFGNNYTDENFGGQTPRWHFKDFLHSFMIVFRVLCGEWIESMWDCMHCGTPPLCIPFFLLTMVIGNLVVLNLFLALLLSSFGAESLQHSQDESGEPNKLQEAVDRINRFVLFIKSHVMYCVKVKMGTDGIMINLDQGITRTDLSNKEVVADGQLPMRNGRVCEHDGSDGEDEGVADRKEASEEGEGKSGEAATRPTSKASSSTARLSQSHSKMSKLSRSVSTCSKDSKSMSSEASIISDSNFSYSKEESRSFEKQLDNMEGPEINEVKVVFVKYPDECCPKCCVRRCKCCDIVDKTRLGQKWWAFRCYMYKLVEHKYFETFIIVMILASSLALAIEDVYLVDRAVLKKILHILDKIFTFIFIFEMLFKWAAYGFKKYFTDAWCWLDFVIVAISLVMLGAEGAGVGNISAFRALRTLRALRPLRAVSRWEGMKVVVNALIQAVPSILNVLVVCLVFWLIFSIMGVQLFGGRFYKCLDPDRQVVNVSVVKNMSQCFDMAHENYTWNNSIINFDNALSGYLALFQVATFKGWITIMEDAVDAQVEQELQPKEEVRVAMYLYFVFFIVFGSFFTLNLFIGVIIDNFNMQKKKAGGSLEMFMTDDQKKYYNAMKKLGSKAPQKPIPKPRFKCQLFFFKLTTNQKFDIGIMTVILLNMITMALEHYQMDEDFKTTLSYINQIFIAIFTLECVMKILGLRWYYFKQPWNVFDFIVVVLSILGLAMDDIIKDLFVSPTLLRVVRVFRVGRVLRLVKSAKGIRTLLFSLAVSLPALFNIGLLLFLVMFIYSVFGMNFFMHVKHTQGLTDMFNFETFGRSIIVLFQISTSAGWDSILAGLMNESNCTAKFEGKDRWGDDIPSDCGSQPMAVLFLVTYLVISFLVVINMYIAVILENFSQATEDVQQGLTQDDFDMYYEIWEKFDEQASQYIPFTRLGEFVDALEEPLNMPLPNHFKLVSMDIPICEDDRVHCVDILDALTKNFLGTGGDPTGDLGDIKKGPERPNYNPVSTTRLRQREIVCAKIVQKAWRDYVKVRTQQPRVQCVVDIVKIEEEDEEENAEQQQEEKKDDEKENPDKDKDIVVEGETGEASLDNDDSRTVELYPESGVVA